MTDSMRFQRDKPTSNIVCSQNVWCLKWKLYNVCCTLFLYTMNFPCIFLCIVFQSFCRGTHNVNSLVISYLTLTLIAMLLRDETVVCRNKGTNRADISVICEWIFFIVFVCGSKHVRDGKRNVSCFTQRSC